MIEKRFTEKLFIGIVLTLAAAGCSDLKDQQVIPPEDLPESVIKVMSDAYPDATDATFQTIEKDRLYEVFYKRNGDPFYAALNTRKILSVFRTYGALPDSMQRALPSEPVSGGAVSDFKEPVPQPYTDRVLNSKYIWGDREYLLNWFQFPLTNRIKYFIRLEPFTKFSFTITGDELNDIPKPMISFFDREKLRFSSVLVSINEKNERGYYVDAHTASGTAYEFWFNQSGKLIRTIYRAEAFYYALDELPEKMQTFIHNSSAFALMKIVEGYKFSDPVGTGYVVSMQGTTDNCSINFDQDGNFVNMTYQTAIYR